MTKAYLLFGIAIICFLVSFGLFFAKLELFFHGITTTGTVISNIQNVERHGVSYNPEISFVTADYQTIQFKSQQNSTDQPTYNVGEKVKVIYVAQDPENAEINDVNILFGTPIIILFFGGILLAVGFDQKKKYNAAIQ